MFLKKKILSALFLSLALNQVAYADQHSFHAPDHPLEQAIKEDKSPTPSNSTPSTKTNSTTQTTPTPTITAPKPKLSPFEQITREISRRKGKGWGTLLLGQLTREMSSYGFRIHPISRKRKLHTGIDFAAPTGTKIFAAADGVINIKKYHKDYGNMIVIAHKNGLETLYAHMSRFAGVSVNQEVKRGELIGYVGSTGRSTGPHLHYEIRRAGKPVNPKKNAHLLQ